MPVVVGTDGYELARLLPRALLGGIAAPLRPLDGPREEFTPSASLVPEKPRDPAVRDASGGMTPLSRTSDAACLTPTTSHRPIPGSVRL